MQILIEAFAGEQEQKLYDHTDGELDHQHERKLKIVVIHVIVEIVQLEEEQLTEDGDDHEKECEDQYVNAFRNKSNQQVGEQEGDEFDDRLIEHVLF